MFGGYETFGNSDWSNTEIAKMLPVRMDASGQIDGKVQMVPTPDGLSHFVMRLADREADNAALWSRLPKLDGATRLGTPKPAAFVLAKSARGEPLLVGLPAYGKGRTLAFAGDTTWLWCTSLEGMRLQARFWQQMILWLAKKEESDGNLLVFPDARRLAAGSRLGFRVKMRGKGGIEISPQNTQIEVSIRQPDGSEVKTPIADQQGELRGSFLKTDFPGEYELIARGSGKDIDGTPLENLPPARARFIIYQDTAELARQAADHAFLERLAIAGGGKAFQADAFKQFLRDLTNEPLTQGAVKPRLWPEWLQGAGVAHAERSSKCAVVLWDPALLWFICPLLVHRVALAPTLGARLRLASLVRSNRLPKRDRHRKRRLPALASRHSAPVRTRRVRGLQVKREREPALARAGNGSWPGMRIRRLQEDQITN